MKQFAYRFDMRCRGGLLAASPSGRQLDWVSEAFPEFKPRLFVL
jgi:hypothetical protein